MEVSKLVEEFARMCKNEIQSEHCDTCPIGPQQKFSINADCWNVNICDLERLASVVEKWSIEHPRETNLDHYTEELTKIGYHVNKDYLSNRCPIPFSDYYTGTEQCPHSAKCEICRKWWNEEYKKEKKE